MFTYILLSIFAVGLCLWYQKRKKHFSLFRKLGIPGPVPNVFFGNYLEIFLKGDIQVQRKWISKYGKVLGYYYGLSPVLLVTDTSLLKNILIKDFQKFIDRSLLAIGGQRVGRGSEHLLFLKGSKWKEVRSVMSPSFTSSKMKMMSPIINNAVNEFLDNMEKFCQTGEPFEIFIFFQKLSLDVIVRTAFGIQCNVQKNPQDPLHQLIRLFRIPFPFFFTLIAKSFDFLKPFTRFVRIFTGSMKNKGINPIEDLLNKCEAVVKSRQNDPSLRRPDLLQLLIDAEIKENIASNYEDLAISDDADKKTNDTEIKYGIVKSRPLTMNEMTSNAFLVLLAGHDTTSTALAFCALMLANFPEVQEKIREEMKNLIKDGNQLDHDSLKKLQYLDQVFKEVLRLYPPVHQFIDRLATENVVYGDIFIPKGTTVQVPSFLIHRDPDYWDRPEEFLPERFAPELANKINPLAWQPFGAGPRNCVGMRFAQMETKLALAQMLYKYRILPCEKTNKYPLELALAPNTIKPKNGVHIRLERC